MQRAARSVRPFRHRVAALAGVGLLAGTLAVGVAGIAEASAVPTVGTPTGVANTTVLAGVACGSASSCLATGQYSSGATIALDQLTNGVPGTASSLSGTSGFGDGAACTSAASCLLVGRASSGGSGVVVAVNGTSVTTQTLPAAVTPTGVACESSTTCFVVGYDGSSIIGYVFPVVSGVVGASMQVPGALLNGACDTATSCLAVGLNPSTEAGVVVPIDNSVVGAPATQTVPSANLSAVACSAPGACVAVSRGFLGGGGYVVPITNGAPGTATSVGGVGSLSGVACVSTTTCVAAGQDNFSTSANGVVVPIISGAPGGAQSVPGTPLAAVACASSTSCVAVGSNDGASTVGEVVDITLPATQAQTTTMLASTPNPSVSGQAVTYTATVSATPAGAGQPTGSVTFDDGSTSIAGCGSVAVAAGVATCTVTYPSPAGSPHSVTAAYTPNSAAFAGSTSNAVVQVVNVAPTTLVAAPLAHGLLTLTFQAKLTRNFDRAGVPGETISFSVQGHPVCQGTTNAKGVASCTVLGVTVVLGHATYTASFGGDGAYGPSTGQGTITTGI